MLQVNTSWITQTDISDTCIHEYIPFRSAIQGNEYENHTKSVMFICTIQFFFSMRSEKNKTRKKIRANRKKGIKPFLFFYIFYNCSFDSTQFELMKISNAMQTERKNTGHWENSFQIFRLMYRGKRSKQKIPKDEEKEEKMRHLLVLKKKIYRRKSFGKFAWPCTVSCHGYPIPLKNWSIDRGSERRK